MVSTGGVRMGLKATQSTLRMLIRVLIGVACMLMLGMHSTISGCLMLAKNIGWNLVHLWY